MEAGRHFLSSSSAFPSTTQLRHPLPPSSPSTTSVLMLHEQAAPAVTSLPTTFITRRFPTSVLLQEQRDEFKPLLHMFKEEKTSQATLDRVQIENTTAEEDFNIDDFYKLVKDFRQLHVSPLQTGENPSTTLASKSNTTANEHMDVKPCDVLTLAKNALSASIEAASLAENSNSIRAGFNESISMGLGWEEETVRSTRLLERRRKRLKKRSLLNTKVPNHETSSFRSSDVRRKSSEGINPNDPLRLFLWGPETRQLLTLKEETELIARVQDVFKLEAVKSRLQSQYGREPTLVEWAEAVGISCQMLQSQLRSGTSSREKLIYANLRMVVHIAKQYQGRGLGLQDLLQEGSMGLMKSVEKFKPQAGCRFATYAYWWVRQTIRKAIFQHSRTIRLPENVYTLLGKVLEAKKSYIQEGNHNPSREELARRVGMSVEKLGKLLYSTRMPVSMQQTVWADQDTTFQEVTADTGIEIPDVSVAKQLMRQHVRNLLHTLEKRERQIIRLRYGIEDGKQRSLSEIGEIFGLSKERVRQLESRAFLKLKESLGSQGLGAYAPLLV
ncbi:RNA polymerase sigma factor sigF, chloroplastic isoform X1 [Rosa rugosa]|uniref:RNA polymerase sigma factor sigF, chloroplastic isoform X1 n=1 Tax=Rosa rugosa TaxID=74645 RepID=UPI002B403EA4|nr:RNA polymerase sigma factor sigF, chloroplastic isoform X1 [Rosa rugosa]